MTVRQRGDKAVRATASKEKDEAKWGGLDPDEWTGKVKLMGHPAYFERYFPNEQVENRKGRGWTVIQFTDPTLPRPTVPVIKTEETPRKPRKAGKR